MDDLDRLGHALRAAPAPDPAARAAAMALAMENFDRLQGSALPPRPISDSAGQAGLWNGVRKMLTTLTSRPILAATTSVAALCLGLVVLLPLNTGPTLPVPVALPEAEADSAVVADAAPAAAVEATDLAQTAPPAPAPATQELEMAAPPSLQMAPAGKGMAASDALVSAVPPAMTRRALAKTAPGTVAEAPMPRLEADSEAFANAAPNPVQITAESPVSTFAIDVDTASYAVVRSSLMAGALPPPDAVRVEEMVNYFPYAYAAPDATGAPFRPTITVMQTPWNAGTQLVQIGLQGRLPALADRPALNLVFLIDTSGSMDEPAKLPLLKQSFRLMLGQLRPEDRVAIVAYAGSAGEVLAPTPASDSAAILAALDRLDAGGGTGGEEGLALAYSIAGRMGGDAAVNRVILATDGDFNLGLSDPAALTGFIAERRAGGTYLSVLGFGRGNLDDATMQALAQAGNGQAAYIDTLQEARKVLVDQLSGALFPIADDVKIQVEWNPAAVAEYRLIGYETRALNREDFNNDKVDAGEIGAGHTLTAIYEITPPGSPALRNDPLRYGAADAAADAGAELGFLRLRWKEPGAATSQLLETPILPGEDAPGEDASFAAAIAGMGQLLRGSVYLGDWGWDQAIALAQGARGADEFGYRAEALGLMRLAQALAAQP